MAKDIIFTSIRIEELRSIIIQSVSEEMNRQLLKGKDQSFDRDKLFSRKETAGILKVSTSSLLSYVKSGRIKAHRVGRRVLFKYEDIQNAMKRIQVSPANSISND